MSVQIEKGVPLPSRGARKTYPWREMEVGDSFEVPFKEGDTTGATTRTDALSSARSVYGASGKVRSQVSNGRVRFWRVG